MTPCSRCNGLCVVEVDRDPLEGVEMEVCRCLNCGHRSYSDMPGKEITVTRGEYYPQRGSYGRQVQPR